MRCFTIPVADSPVLGSSDGHAGVVRVGGTAGHSLVRQARTEVGQSAGGGERRNLPGQGDP